MKNRLADLRKTRGISQVTLAQIFEVSETTVVRWEREHTTIPHETVFRLAHYFGVTPSDILPGYSVVPTATDLEAMQHA